MSGKSVEDELRSVMHCQSNPGGFVFTPGPVPFGRRTDISLDLANPVPGNASHSFQPKVHLCPSSSVKVRTMEELGFADDVGISKVAVTEPFPLLTKEAVLAMRDEISQASVWKEHTFKSNLAQTQLRGFATKYAPFIEATWKNPETLKIVSRAAGIDLVPVMDYEIGHTNVSVSEQANNDNNVKEASAVGWHTDSYPFVCVLMLSDCVGMEGGETVIAAIDGTEHKIRSPQMGFAIVLQGRYVKHQALRVRGGPTRVTMVTSFRPKSTAIKDDTVLTTVRPVSDLQELYHQFVEYRLGNLQEQLQAKVKQLKEDKEKNKELDTLELQSWLKEQMAYLEHTSEQFVAQEKVIAGQIDT